MFDDTEVIIRKKKRKQRKYTRNIFITSGHPLFDYGFA